VKEWWSRVPDANIAIATGKESDLVVLDVDGPEGEVKLAALEGAHGALPTTAEVKTGKGRHLHFAYPRNTAKVKSIARQTLDIRADGGYVVAPPSLHANGREYAFARTDVQELAECPAWVVAYANGKSKTLTTQRGTDKTATRECNARSTLIAAAEDLSVPPPWSVAEEARVREALLFVSAETYEIWICVGMALHWTGWGERALLIWDEWSSAVPEKY
jgi:hypothetical protein